MLRAPNLDHTRSSTQSSRMDHNLRVLGDVNRGLSILLLIYHIRSRQSSAGISFKSQCLYAVVFATQHLGSMSYVPSWTWSHPQTFFISSLRVLLILGSLYILYLIKWVYKIPPQSRKVDTFKIRYLLLGAFVPALFLNNQFSFIDTVILSFNLSYQYVFFAVYTSYLAC